MNWIIVLTLMAPFAYAETVPSFEELCTYDKMCKQAQNGDGSLVTPKASLIKMLSELKTPIRVIAHQMGVDPRAVAGAIIAENSMNVQVDDDVHTFMEKIKKNPAANAASKILRGKSFSLGLGQIKPESAFEGEEALAAFEKRPKYSLERVTQELLTPLGSLRYAAAIIKTCQDQYMKQGMDISKEPAILTSLYNLGKCEQLAADSKANNRKPRPNYFGYFVHQYIKDVESVVDYKSPYQESEAKELEQLSSDGGNSAGKSKFVKSFTRFAPLYAFPAQCDISGGGNADRYTRDKSYQMPIEVSKGAGDFEIVSGGVDCDLEDWSLVKAANGKMGWISNKELDKVSTERVAGNSVFTEIFGAKTPHCDPAASGKCQTAAKKSANDRVLGPSADNSRFVDVKLVGATGHPDDVNVKSFSAYCLRGEGGSYGGYGGSSLSKTPIQQNEATALVEQVENKKKEIVAQMGYKDWDDSGNAFKNYFSYFEVLKSCAHSKCTGPVKELKELLADDFGKYKGYRGFANFFGKYGYGLSFEQQSDSQPAKSDREKWLALFGSIEEKCKPVFEISKDAAAQWSEFRAGSKVDDPDSKTPPLNYGYDEFLKSCDLMSKRLKPRTASENTSTEGTVCASCNNMSANFHTSSGGTYGISLSADVISSMLQEPEDYAEFFSSAMQQIRYAFPNSAYKDVNKSCKYDPLESAKRIEALLKLDCVDTVFVPDLYLVNSLRKYGARVLYKPFDQDDRFAFTVKNSCNEGAAAK